MPCVVDVVSTERVTCYVPSFTKHKNVQGAVYEQAACGKFVGWTACAPAEQEPTCRACREWLGLEVDAPEYRCLYCGQPMPDEAMRMQEFTYCSSACENAARTE